jgi:hypothetical protein
MHVAFESIDQHLVDQFRVQSSVSVVVVYVYTLHYTTQQYVCAKVTNY